MSLRRFLSIALVLLTGCSAFHSGRLMLTGGTRELRERPDDAPPNSPALPGLLVLAIDGVDRSLLYDMLRHGELPGLAALLGDGSSGTFAHAYFDPDVVATLPSSTLAAWSTAMTGVPPAVHGVTGNEYFVRSEKRLAAPAPVSFDDATPVLETYTDDYVNELVGAPTVYEQMRQRDPDVLIWVAMHQIFRGADQLLLTRRTVLVDAFQSYAEKEGKQIAEGKQSWANFAALDKEVVHDVIANLDDGPLPDVLTVYVSGTDLFTHVAAEGPDAARRAYLREVLDPLLVDLREALAKRGALDNRYVVVTADHGHTQVVHDTVHALGAEPDGGAVALLRLAGFRVRPFALEVPADADFQAVLAYGGALAYVYLADRSVCPNPGDVCDWTQPPRGEEDLLTVADTFYTNNIHGAYVPQLRGTLDMVLVRPPHPADGPLPPFQVYVGKHKLEPIADYLRSHPHDSYVDLSSRLNELGVGPRGDHAGDIILIAHSGDRTEPAQRYYFAALYHSWHGSPSRGDSDIPLIVAHPQRTAASIGALVQSALGPHPHQQRVTDVLLALRFGAPISAPR